MKYYTQLLESLDKFQTAAVDHWVASHGTEKAKTISDHVMKGEDTIHVPLLNGDDHNHTIPSEIHEHLKNNGFSIASYHDYRAGYAVDKHDRIVSIGKALHKSKASHELKSQFENDPNRQTQSSDLHVAITRNPHQVAGVSTDRGWTSCMHMYTGANSDTLEKDIQHGTHVAYLVHKNDTDIQNPISRISLKPHVNESGHTILRPEKTIYGTPTGSFHDTVKQWSETHFPVKNGTYRPHGEIYDETGGVYSNINPEKEHAKFIHIANPSNHDGVPAYNDEERHNTLEKQVQKIPAADQHTLLDKISQHPGSADDRFHMRLSLIHHTKTPSVVDHALEGMSPEQKHTVITGSFKLPGSKFGETHLSYSNKNKINELHKSDAVDHAIETGKDLHVRPTTDELAKKISDHVGVSEYFRKYSAGAESREFVNSSIKTHSIGNIDLIASKFNSDSIHTYMDRKGSELNSFDVTSLQNSPDYGQEHANKAFQLTGKLKHKFMFPNVKGDSLHKETLKNIDGLPEYILNNGTDIGAIHKAIDSVEAPENSHLAPVKSIRSVARLADHDPKIKDWLIHSPSVDRDAISHSNHDVKYKLSLDALKSEKLSSDKKFKHLKTIMEPDSPISYKFAAVDAVKGTELEEPARNALEKEKRKSRSV